VAHPIRGVVTEWEIERSIGDAAGHHGRPLCDDGRRRVWVLEVDAPALVLGSVQPEADVDARVAASRGIEVVRRRSGGGAVLVEPDAVAWVDLVVPRGDPLWHDDVGVAAEWVGEVWRATLDQLGRPDGEVHRGGLIHTPLAPVVCFAGIGPGEVLVGGRKVVGISQRRTRHAARFQCSVPLRWDAPLHAALLAPGIERVRPGVDAVAAVEELPVLPLEGVDAEVIVDALLAHLP
jgi:lipoate-protein ligase A